jgi:PAS domain-containing protein
MGKNMRKVINWMSKRKSIRKTAESLLPKLRAIMVGQQPTEMLLNELLLNKVELEIQIEELQRNSVALEASRDRYRELYDYSPVGYLTLNHAGMVVEINLKAATLLGIDRLSSHYPRFSSCVVESYIAKWDIYFARVMTRFLTVSQPVLVNMICAEGTVFSTQLICRRTEEIKDQPTLRVTLVDLSQVCDSLLSTSLA